MLTRSARELEHGHAGRRHIVTGARGAVACGHPVTCEAASAMLRAGGNAFDAAAAGLWAACVAEPLLASPGGGGFLLARPVTGAPRVYDFFAQTPCRRSAPGATDFHPVLADFVTTRQEFHIGLGSVATPGVVAGLCAFQRELGRMPQAEILQPAIAAARDGVIVNALQADLARILAPIVTATPGARAVFAPGGTPPGEGERHAMPALAELLAALAAEGPDLFYRGEIAAIVDALSREGGGHLRRDDLEQYRVERREPLAADYRGHRILTNPPPASGGLLVAFGLEVLAGQRSPGDSSAAAALLRTADALAATQEARVEAGLDLGVDAAAAARLLDPAAVARYREQVAGRPHARRGTTHVSVVDAAGNAAALSVSNGEGCGDVVPGAGFMLNNMLGEADLQPRGFERWPLDTRLTSMMAPTVITDRAGVGTLALGSGGSNRIRSALLQVIAGHVELGLGLEAAVQRPRLHVEGERLEIEGGLDEAGVAALTERWADHCVWPDRNLFFGGVHVAAAGPEGFSGVGDPRRGGVSQTP